MMNENGSPRAVSEMPDNLEGVMPNSERII